MSTGTTWTCDDRDICNGAFVGDSYVYVGSDTFPYVVGCWGPGPQQLYEAGCSNSSCGTLAATTSTTTDSTTETGAMQSAFASVTTLAAVITASLF